MISGVIHTYNEAENITRALESIASWVDEIVVVDMGSTDGTLEKVSPFTKNVFNFQYTGFVEPARNFALSKARGDWIFILDADEEVPHTLATFLREVTHQDIADYFQIPRKNIIFDRWITHGGWWPDYQTRFFKKGHVSWVEKIHGVPLTQGRGKDLEALETQSIIHHHYRTVREFVGRLNRYTTITSQELHQTNEPFSPYTLMEKPRKEFVSRFFAREGYKEGVHGLALSKLQEFSELVVQLKLWELEGFPEESIPMNFIEQELKADYHDQSFWLMREKLKKPHTKLEELLWRLKRYIVKWL